MSNIKHPEYIVISLMLAFFVCGCGQDTPISGRSVTPAAIELYFAPDAAMQESITDIEITILAPDSEEPVEFILVHVDDASREKQLIETSIQLPVAIPLDIIVIAFESDCPILEFRGKIEINPDEDEPVVIPIELSPLQMVFGISSEQDKASLAETYILDIYVQDASKLVSFVCELDFDENLLELLSIETGDLLVGKTGLLELDDYLDIEENNSSPIALGFTERADTGEKICGSGSMFRLSFRTKDVGTANFEILNDSIEVWVLRNDDFVEVTDSEQVEIMTEHSVIVE